MWKRISQYLFKTPDEIGLDNYLVLALCFFIFLMAILGIIINIFLKLGLVPILSTGISGAIFGPIYLYSKKTGKYIISKYSIIIVSIVILNIQWFVNFGSSGPILYLFVMVESFILIFFIRLEKVVFTLIVFLDVTILFLIEYYYPETIGSYGTESSRLLDLYSGILIDLIVTILLLNIAIKFYITQQEKATLSDKLKSAFLANMSHEIRTPMNGILGFAQLLKEPNLTGEEQQTYISIIEKSGERMLNIINDIIDISKIEAGLMNVDMKQTNVNDLIEFIYSFFKNEVEDQGIQFSFKCSLPSKTVNIKTDTEKLYAILINLVKNSIKYTDKGSIEFGYNKKLISGNTFLQFYVKDTGIGIPLDRHEAIFERFIQADMNDIHAFQGAGLGLSISRAYVEMLGGTIRVDSEPGRGTTFYFTIPFSTEHIEEKESGTEVTLNKPIEPPVNLKIMIAEDDMASEMLISREVNKYSRELLIVNSGIKAVEVCRNNPDIDLILMDIKMPGIDGYEATREIRKFNSDVIIIAQTAFALAGDMEKSLEAGCNGYISKPINNKALQKLILEHITKG